MEAEKAGDSACLRSPMKIGQVNSQPSVLGKLAGWGVGRRAAEEGGPGQKPGCLVRWFKNQQELHKEAPGHPAAESSATPSQSKMSHQSGHSGAVPQLA